MSEAVVFQSSVESIRRMTDGKLSPACRQELRVLGFDFDKPLLSAYPLGPWERATELILGELFPLLPLPEARIELGRLFMKGFAETAIGSAAVMFGKAIGVRRTLSRMTRNMRNGNNYTETELVEHGPGHIELITRMLPSFLGEWANKPSPLGEQFVGVLRAAMELLGAKEAVVTLKAYDPRIRQTSYDVRWRE